MTNQMTNENESVLASGLTNGPMALEPIDCVGVWIPDAAIIEAERRRKEELIRRERPFLEVPRHPVMEESPPEAPSQPGGTVIILDI